MKTRTTARAALAMLLALGAGTHAWAQDPQADVLREVGFDQHLGQSLPLDAALRDESGRTVRLGDYFGKRPVILSLVYYECPMLCTLTLNGLVSALDVLSFDPGREFEIVTVSFEPKETPALAAAKKQAYLRRYKRPGAAAGWHFLTGDAAAIARITKAVGFRYVWDERTRQYAHASGVVVVTPQGHLARYLYGVEYAPKDLRLALVEAAENRIGTVADRLLLFCYNYDPVRGRYGLVVMRMVRVGALLTVGALATFVFVMWRRERRLGLVAGRKRAEAA